MAVKYIPYFPDTIEGQAILDNIVRTKRILKYRDIDKVVNRIKRGMPYYELEKTEEVRNPTLLKSDEVGIETGKNLLIRGDCLSTCAYLKEKGIKIDLVYIDPPFASGAEYAKKVFIRRNPKVAKAIELAEGKLDDEELKAFDEKMYGDIWNKEDYLNWMFECLMAIRSVMSETGCIYVHLDWHIGHYVKILMDEVFGEDCFKNEIIWHYRTGNISEKQFQRKHDTILLYSKSEKMYFKSQEIKEYYFCIYGPGKKIGFKGRKHGEDKYGEYCISFVDDVWNISAVFTLSDEHTEYNTQKPEELIERIFKASSEKGMIVADFFGGSGVSAVVANKLGRYFIQSDVGINSLQTTRDRLVSDKASFDILDIKDGVSLYRNPAQTMNKLKTLISGLRNEDSLDSFWEGAIQDSKLGLIPVYVPNLIDHSTKVLDLPLMNRILNQAIPDLPGDVKKIIVFFIDIEDIKELKDFIKNQNITNIDIELRDLKEILDDVILNDIVKFKLKTIKKKGFEIEVTKFISDRLIQKIDEYNQKKKLNKQHKELFDNEKDDEDIDDAEENTDVKNKKKFNPIKISKEGLELIELISLDCTNKQGVWISDKEIKIDKKGYVIEDGMKTKKFWNAKIFSVKKPLRMKVRNIAGDETIMDL